MNKRVTLKYSSSLVHCWLSRTDIHTLTGSDETLRSEANEHAFTLLDRALNLVQIVGIIRPREGQATQFTLGVGTDGVACLEDPLRVLSITPGFPVEPWTLLLECEYLTPGPPAHPRCSEYRRYYWPFGDPEPAVIAELGLEVVE